MRKIPKKNYLILLLLTVVTILLVFFLISNFKKEEKQTTAMTYLSEIKENELKNYITENHDVIIYMASSNKEQTKILEEELKSYILENSLETQIVYLDLKQVSDHFYEDFSDNYLKQSSNLDLTEEPIIVTISDGYVLNYLSNLKSVEELKTFFENNEVLE